MSTLTPVSVTPESVAAFTSAPHSSNRDTMSVWPRLLWTLSRLMSPLASSLESLLFVV